MRGIIIGVGVGIVVGAVGALVGLWWLWRQSPDPLPIQPHGDPLEIEAAVQRAHNAALYEPDDPPRGWKG